MTLKALRKFGIAALVSAGLFGAGPAIAQTNDYQAQIDTTLGTEMRAPQTFEAVYQNAFEQRIAELADGSRGRIGVAAVDLSTGQRIAVLGDQRFPMASTSKIAIAATFLDGVERGRWSLTSEFPLLLPRLQPPVRAQLQALAQEPRLLP